MIKEFIGVGKTIEEAMANAKAGLNAPLSADVKTEIIAMPKKKLFGLFGGSDAQVKASYDDGKREKKAQPKAKKPANKGNKKPAGKNQPTGEAVKTAAPKKEFVKEFKAYAEKAQPNETANAKKDIPKSVDLEYAKTYLLSILKGLNIDDAKVDASYSSEGVISMDLVCSDYGIVIGRRGETLDSIQYLVCLAMKKKSNGYVRVAINIGDYRERRNETLRALAAKNAAYVMRTGRRYTFEPMNPYERRVIHTAIQEIEGVESRSIGYNQDRRVVIEPVGGVKHSGGYRRNNHSRPRGAAAKEQAPVRPPREDKPGLPKYGKIEINKD